MFEAKTNSNKKKEQIVSNTILPENKSFESHQSKYQIKLPQWLRDSLINFPQKNIDPTFIASVFTGVLASFGIQTAKNKNGNGATKSSTPPISKADLDKLIEKAANTAPAQTIRIEQAPMVFAPTPNKKS